MREKEEGKEEERNGREREGGEEGGGKVRFKNNKEGEKNGWKKV